MDESKDLLTVKIGVPDENADGVIVVAGIEFVSIGGGDVLIAGSILSWGIVGMLLLKVSNPLLLKFSKM